jgi:hypothetical protein
MAAELRASELRVADLVAELGSREDALGRAAAEASDLRAVVGRLDQERDALQVRICRAQGGWLQQGHTWAALSLQ